MSLVDAVLGGFELLLVPDVLLAAFLGGVIGYLAGAIPGLNQATFLAVILPFIILLPTVPALAFIAGLYGAAEVGSSLPGILFSVPGTAGAGPAALEGYPLARQGRGVEAITVSVVSSLFGAVFGGIVAVVLFHYLGAFALRIGPAELFAFAVLGIAATATLAAGDSLSQGVLSAALGSLAGLVGTHEVYVLSRATFDRPELYDGFPIIAVVLGIFGVSEALARMTSDSDEHQLVPAVGMTGLIGVKQTLRTVKAAARQVASYPVAIVQSLGTGALFGLMPGVGVSAASFTSYGLAKTMSKKPEEYGNGSVEGLVASESANNSIVPAELVPVFVLGLPGSIVSGLALAVMLLHGLAPGPAFFRDYETLGISLIIASVLGVAAAAFVGIVFCRVIVKLVNLPRGAFIVSILTVSMVGAYSAREVPFDMFVTLCFGVVGFLIKRAGWPIAPFLIGFLLVGIAERQLLRLSTLGGTSVFLDSPVAVAVGVLAVLLAIAPAAFRARRRAPTRA